MRAYTRKVHYYETDMMGITHHANYILWMEEARIDFMDQLGFPYSKMESDGIRSPLRSISCVYKNSSTFGDTIIIDVSLESFNGVLLTILYEMRNQKNEIICEARSEHVFVNRGGHIIRLKRKYPDFYQAVVAEIERAEKDRGLKKGDYDEESKGFKTVDN